jgi:hypothetical protein
MSSIYQENSLKKATTLQAELFSSVMIINHGAQGFELQPLPIQAQFSPITGLLISDYNQDDQLDLLYTGNFYGAEVETVRYDAGIGGLLLGNKQTQLMPVSALKSGFMSVKNARDLKSITLGKARKPAIIVTNNQAKLQFFKLNAVSR